MVGVDDGRDARTGIPVTSLYGETFESLTPTAAELEGIDVLVVDLQDVGSRYYTYVWTMALALGAAARARRRGRRARPARTRSAASPSRAARCRTRLHVVRGPGRGPGAPRPDDRRGGAAGGGRDAVGRGALRAAARLRSDGGAGARLAARDDVRGDGPALGDAVAEHADAGHRAGLSGAVPVRGDEPLRGARHDAAVRDRRGAVPRRARAGRRRSPRRSPPGVRLRPLVVPADVPQVRRPAVRRRAAARRRRGRVPSLPHRASR